MKLNSSHYNDSRINIASHSNETFMSNVFYSLLKHVHLSFRYVMDVVQVCKPSDLAIVFDSYPVDLGHLSGEDSEFVEKYIADHCCLDPQTVRNFINFDVDPELSTNHICFVEVCLVDNAFLHLYAEVSKLVDKDSKHS